MQAKVKAFLAIVREVPFVLAVSLALMGSAIDLLIKVGPNPTGQFTVGLLAIMAFLGGLLIITGIFWRGSRVIANGIERTGHVLAMAAWFIDGALIFGEAKASLIVPVALFVASGIRAYYLGRRNKDIVNTVQTLGDMHSGN